MQTSLVFSLFSLLPVIGHCLQCEICSNKSDSCVGMPYTCHETENACLILTMENIVENERWLVTYKGCTKTKHCPPSPVSLTFPSQRKWISSKCCHKDLCNNGAVKVLRLGTKQNGLKCPACFSTNPTCETTETLSCYGQEHKCISYAVTIEEGKEVYVYSKSGCGTKRACMDETVTFGVLGTYIESWTDSKCTEPLKTSTWNHKFLVP